MSNRYYMNQDVLKEVLLHLNSAVDVLEAYGKGVAASNILGKIEIVINELNDCETESAE